MGRGRSGMLKSLSPQNPLVRALQNVDEMNEGRIRTRQSSAGQE